MVTATTDGVNSGMITLFDYQHTLLENGRAAYRAGVKRLLMVSPTGSGKTVMFAAITSGAIKLKRRVWALAHRAELLDQISATLKEFGVPHGFIAADYPQRPSAPVQVCSVQTLVNRMQRHHKPDLIIVDEAHHATTKNTIGRILAANPQARVLGVTATPERLSGEGMGEVFSDMLIGPTVQQLIDLGRLSPVRVFAPPTIDTSGLHTRAGDFIISESAKAADKPKITGDVIEHYRKLADGKRAVAFCCSIEHAHHVAEQFKAAGYRALKLDGGMDKGLRREGVQMFREGALDVITSCDLISEGFDLPAIEVGISLRPTASLGLWLQQCGRCLRVFPGKREALILDHAGNTLRHGLPNEDREWTLEGRERRGGKESGGVPSVRVCPKCFSANRAGSVICGGCGAAFPVVARKIGEVDGELAEVVSARRKPKATPERQEQGRANSLEALIEIQMRRNGGDRDKAERWASYVWEGRQKKRRVS